MGQRPHIVKQSQNKGNQIKERCIAENIAGRFLISAVYRKRRSNLGQRLPQISDDALHRLFNPVRSSALGEVERNEHL